MIDVSEIIEDPDFASDYTVTRDAGEYVKGVWVPDTTDFNITSAVVPYSPQQAEYTENGDFITGEMAFYSKQVLYTTREDGISDVLTYEGVKYKISHVKLWGKFGYYKAIAMRISTI